MKRKSAIDESLLQSPSYSRKRVRSQELDPTETFEDANPTKAHHNRPRQNGELSTRSRELAQGGSGVGSPQPRGHGSNAGVQIGIETPTKRGRGRPKGSVNRPKVNPTTSTPTKPINGKVLFSTPKTNGGGLRNGETVDYPDADRSARRKSARTIIERTITDDTSEDEQDENLARQIYDSDDEERQATDNEEELGTAQEPDSAPTTPSKRGRGRPKGSKNRQRSLTPPQDLPPHELYFFHNRGGGSKTSNNNLSTLALLDHGEYFNLMRNFKDPHNEDIEFLHELHSRSFNQWQFELSQGFNICVFGWGSKKKLLTSFAEDVYKSETSHENNKIVIVNGYLQNTNVRDVLNTLAGAISDSPPKLGAQVAEVLDTVCSLLESDTTKQITLLINSIDAPPLRRPNSQTLLARLASHPQIHLVASASHPSFPLLWDSSLRSTYNFLFHDCTTFAPHGGAEVDVVNEVHELLGRSGRRVGGKEGVSFVLKSLNQNSRKLFQLLVVEQLAAMDDGGDGGGFMGQDDDNAEYDDDMYLDDRRGNSGRRTEQGVEYRLLYQKAVEDFICGDEVSFRTLLKEFHDHQMIHSRKDAMGTEMLSVPFRKEELETILEDLMS